MIISDEEYFEFMQNAQRYNLEKIKEIFPDDEDEVKIKNE